MSGMQDREGVKGVAACQHDRRRVSFAPESCPVLSKAPGFAVFRAALARKRSLQALLSCVLGAPRLNNQGGVTAENGSSDGAGGK